MKLAPAEQPATPGLARAGAVTYLFSGGTLVANMATGILLARGLGVGGRGEVAAIGTVAQITAWVFSLGASQAVAYHQAKNPDEGDRLLGTWLVLIAPLASVAFGIAVLVLPLLFAAQDPDTVTLGRVFALTIVLIVWHEVISGFLLGDHDFTFWNMLRVGQPAATGVAFAALWATGSFSVETALATLAVTAFLAPLLGTFRAVGRHGLGRPSRAMARRTVWYGVRGHGGNIASLATARLDLLILPAFVAASSVGLYSVAINVSWVLFGLSSAFAAVVMPTAARHGRSVAPIVKAFRATLGTAVLAAILLVVFAEVAIRIVYGAEFAPAADALRILLPGTACLAGAQILTAGLLAEGRPGTATLVEACGGSAMVAGLLVVLPRTRDIISAAGVSTLSYVIVLIAAMVFYRSATGIAWRTFLSPDPDPLPEGTIPEHT